jgi:hypothetical protein
MITILVDHNMEGQATLLSGAFVTAGWMELIQIRFVTFADIGLALDSSDRAVWRFAQAHQLILLTDNRSMKGADSLEQTLREEQTSTSLPVITIGSVNRIDEQEYRESCVERLVELLLDVELYLGTNRLFIP